jgi:putative tryptophan/tyrosine transport system substrate-binding protein
MKRRQLLAGAGSWATAAVGFAANAQQSAMPTVGFLTAGDPEPSWTLFKQSMAALGYVEGRTVQYEFRAGDSDRLPALANELVQAAVNVIVANLTPAILAASKATTRIPIVFNGGIPETGMVRNMARPEGNLTGLYGATALIAGKSIEIFRDIIPTARTIALLLNVPDPFRVPLQREIEAAARAQQVEILPVMINARSELPAAYEALAARKVDGVIVQPTLGFHETAALALKHRLAAMSFRPEFARNGGLLAYSADPEELFQLVAGYVDKVLKGAPTASLPVQLATRFQLFVNRKTAGVLGLTLSPMFLNRADEVIE